MRSAYFIFHKWINGDDTASLEKIHRHQHEKLSEGPVSCRKGIGGRPILGRRRNLAKVIPAGRVENYLEPRFYRWAPKQLLQASPDSAGHAHQNCAAAPLRLMLAQNNSSPSRTCQEYFYADQKASLIVSLKTIYLVYQFIYSLL